MPAPAASSTPSFRALLRALLLLTVASTAIAADPSGQAVISPPTAAAGDAAAPKKGALEDVLAPITEDRLFAVSDVGVQVVNVRTGEEVFARDAEVGLIPASTMKIVTAAAALRTLGPSWRFTTDVYTDEGVQVDGAGVLDGNLYVQGHGDPTLVVEDIWKMVYDLELQGITKIDGNVVYDESFMDTDYRLPGWDKKEDLEKGPSYFPPLGALSVNYNNVGLVVGPGTDVGKSARVVLETPAGDHVEIVNEVVTTAAGGRRVVRVEREVLDDERVKFTLSGTVPADADADFYYRTVADPTAHFMAVFREMLATQGITVTGKHVRGTAPADGELLLERRSPPLSTILGDMNKQSNNFMAEQVLRAVGAEVHGYPGTTAKGLQVVGDYLTGLGVDAKEYHLVNGSGLSRDLVLRPTHLTAVLLDMARDPKVGHEFVASLSIAGQDGTLWRRLAEDPGRLRGKTGTIDGIHCLTGYVEAADGEMYAFSFLVNDVRGDSSQVKRLHDKFARRLFTVGLPVAEVVEGGEEAPEE